MSSLERHIALNLWRLSFLSATFGILAFVSWKRFVAFVLLLVVTIASPLGTFPGDSKTGS